VEQVDGRALGRRAALVVPLHDRDAGVPGELLHRADVCALVEQGVCNVN